MKRPKLNGTKLAQVTLITPLAREDMRLAIGRAVILSDPPPKGSGPQ